MGITSNTGLFASVPRANRIIIQEEAVTFPNAAKPAPYVLRPFAGVYNPFPYGCSILCNHPADREAKHVVKQAKDSWASEGKSLSSCELAAALGCARNDLELSVPEELFRRYTDTDSRPPTPAPTPAPCSSAAQRRCVTPDADAAGSRRRTTLVLDLRRSQSQDTLSLQGLSVPPSGALPPTRTPSPPRGVVKRKSAPSRKPCVAPATQPRSVRSVRSDGEPLSAKSAGQKQPSPKPPPPPPPPPPEIRLPDGGEGAEESPKRRGKRRKGRRSAAGLGPDEPDVAFKDLLEPGETQVSALEAESSEHAPLGSAFSGDEPTTPEAKSAGDTSASTGTMGSSFIVAAILKQLRRGLKHEMIDAEFEPRRKLALVEAIRSWPSGRRPAEGKGIRTLRAKLQISKQDDRWLLVPRIFSRQSARFELPLDSRTLNSGSESLSAAAKAICSGACSRPAAMTPMQYVAGHVAVSSGRRQLYNQVFNRHREDARDEDESQLRLMAGSRVAAALREVLGQPLPAAHAASFQTLLGWSDACALDFRAWSGVAAAAERVLGPELMSAPPRKLDPCHEVEQADFETLPCKLARHAPCPRLAALLMAIRDL